MADLAQVVAKHIKKHWKTPECSLCGANTWDNWVMNGPFALVPVGVDENGYVSGYRPPKVGSPVISMVCYQCGHTLLIDYSIIIGMDP